MAKPLFNENEVILKFGKFPGQNLTRYSSTEPLGMTLEDVKRRWPTGKFTQPIRLGPNNYETLSED
jgi:hypothetical protein